jgi:agmatinase
MNFQPKNLTFYTSGAPPFSGRSSGFEEADYVVIGIPYDKTSTYRSGSKFGPSAIREASSNIETYSLRTSIDVEDLKIYDAGDLNVVDSVEETLKRIKLLVEDVVNSSKIPILIGGEHTLTYGAVQGIGSNVGLISFDAHADLRNEYMGLRVSHATFMRRIAEYIGPKNVLEVGVRALCKEEVEYANGTDVTMITTQRLRELGPEKAAELVRARTKDFKRAYITIDIDVLDPAFAPAVGSPEGDGICPNMLITILNSICDRKTAGIDLVEVAPQYDTGTTSAQAARILFEALCAVQNSRVR